MQGYGYYPIPANQMIARPVPGGYPMIRGQIPPEMYYAQHYMGIHPQYAIHGDPQHPIHPDAVAPASIPVTTPDDQNSNDAQPSSE